MITAEYLNSLKYSWTAVVKAGGRTCVIWWTALPSMRHTITEVVSVSSDYPRYEIKKRGSLILNEK